VTQNSFEQKKQQCAERLGIDAAAVPGHVAIIMDGNGRWAQERGLPRFEGHREGAKTVEKVVLHAVKCGVKCVTLYSFSMQNWKRPEQEIDFLMHLYSRYLVEIRPTLKEHNVRLVHLGRTQGLPDRVVKDLQDTIEITAGHSGMTLGLALNYGARTEIIDAMKNIAEKIKTGSAEIEEIDEAMVNRNLYTAEIPDPDVVVRTSGEMRISNFLLWQISYAEFYVTNTYWPDFMDDEFDNMIRAFAKRQRRFGDVEARTGTRQ
jgi:undecaprenyl diphosphate synthase